MPSCNRMGLQRPWSVFAWQTLATLMSEPALASFHLTKVTEVFAGASAAPNAQYVELQMYFDGQNFVGGQSIVVYDAAGNTIAGGTFTFPGSVANGTSQATILIATTEAGAFFGVSSDLVMTPVIPLAGGKVCFDGVDCVVWGGYAGSPAGVGTPFNGPVGITRGSALRRRLDICGSPVLLDDCDDTDVSSTDFVFAAPAPRNNAGATGTIPPSTCGDGALQGLEQCDDGNTVSGDGCSASCSFEPGAVAPQLLSVDAVGGSSSNGNGVLEPGEAVPVDPSWKNMGASSLALTGTASTFTGPAGASYSIPDGSAGYGTVAPGATAGCGTASGDCYRLAVSVPGARPSTHWDATAVEVLSNTALENWTLHVGGSFADVPASHAFYRFIENVLHNGVTAGCSSTGYCPASAVTRAQVAVLLLRSAQGAAYTPPPATGVFDDVPANDPFASWIEDLSTRGITAGCSASPPLYCPGNPVLRSQVAVLLLRTLLGAGYTPPAATGIFQDVPASDPFASWIEDISSRGITSGCSASPAMYCPGASVTRGQVAAFLVRTFGLVLYGP